MREIVFMCRHAPLTALLVGICTLYFLYGWFLKRKMSATAVAYRLGAIEVRAISQAHQYWRLLTAGLIHIDGLHYLFNMLFLMDVGTWLEFHLKMPRYLVLLLLSGLCSSGLTYLYDKRKHLYHLTFGASGFAFGILGYLAGLMLFGGAVYLETLRSFIPLIVINLFYTFSRKNISKTGHLGGMLAGLLFSLL